MILGNAIPLRAATPDDIAAIESLLARCYPVLMAAAYPPSVLDPALPAMLRANPALVGSGLFWLYHEDAKILGCGGVSLTTPGSQTTTPGLAHIRHFAVDPNHQGRGIGTSLFRQASRTAATLGANRLQALSSLNAEAFYAAMGLVRIATRAIAMGPGPAFPVIVMEADLPIA